MEIKNCNNCFYNKGTYKKGCMTLHEKQGDCDSWADEEEAKRREEAIRQYSSAAEPSMSCTPVKDVLDKHFMRLYQNNYNDIEIAETLGVSASSVGTYRKKLGLKIQNKRKKPAGTGK